MTEDKTTYCSRLPGLRSRPVLDRLSALCDAAALPSGALNTLGFEPSLPPETADGMIENVVGVFELPVGIATNFLVNGKDYLVPMAVEEPSVVAAASYMARIARENGGFQASATDPVMRAQIQILSISDPETARQKVLKAENDLIDLANRQDETLVSIGGGCRGIEVEVFEQTRVGPMVVVHLLVDVRDAMGANAVNTMAEAVAPGIADLTGGRTRLRILSNLADRRTVSASVTVSSRSLDTDGFPGSRCIDGIIEACALAEVDPYRAATHNKGIMNGVDPVVLATGNDWRAIEAGAHAWAARSGRYTSLTRWDKDADGNLTGRIEMPMAVGLIGGATRTHPSARAAIELMRIQSASELGMVIASVGLAQNMAALRALATEGIQKGHMALHARNLAIAAGATGANIERVASQMVEEGVVTADRAQALLQP